MLVNKWYNFGLEIFPICRSITGYGTRKTLKLIKQKFNNLKIVKVKSGKRIYDWKVPLEWNIHDAYIEDEKKNKLLKFSDNNLHIINYSIPVNKILNKQELLSKLHFFTKNTDAIHYLTSYYKKKWGFCCSYNFYKKIKKNYKSKSKFKVVINSSLKKGYLNYGELIIKGNTNDEILISTYICHPSMANNELSGPLVSMMLIEKFKKYKKMNKTIRFIFIPETIGSIAFLHKNLDYLKKNLIGGYNLSCIGDERSHSCILTKYKNKLSDAALIEAYEKLNIKPKIYSFLNRGSDERQYNAPGIDLPVASIFRTKYGEYPEYHTSLDNFDVVTKKGLNGGYKVAKTAIEILLKKIVPRIKVLCEPQMSKRGIYPTLSKGKIPSNIKDLMNFITYADGSNDLLKISQHIKKDLSTTKKIYGLLKRQKLIN